MKNYNFLMSKKYFVTFGSKDFKLQRKHIVNLVKNSGFYDEAIEMGPEDLTPDFKSKFSEILKIKRGYGFWIWKVDVLNQLLSKINFGDSITYSSAGSSFNPLGIDRLHYYFELLESSKSGNLRFRLPAFKEYEWTNKQILDYFKVDRNSKIANSDQLSANTLFMKKNEVSLNIVNGFLDIINHDPKIITLEYDKIDQINGFIENRSDQSILSVLSKLNGVETILDQEQNFNQFDMSQFQYPFLTVRQRKYNIFKKLLFYLNYKKRINSPIYFYRKITIIDKVIYHMKIEKIKEHLKKLSKG